MPRSTRKISTPGSPKQTAEYTYDMLTALREIAAARGQETLAQLLAAAAAEAHSLVARDTGESSRHV